MTFSSSVGWPLSGPMTRVRRWPLISVPRTKVRRSRPTPAAAHVYLYWRSQRSERTTIPSVVATISAAEEPDRAGPRPGPSVLPKKVWLTRSCGQPLHQQERDPAEHRDGRQQDLVRAAPGQDLRGMGDEERRDVDEQPLRVVQTELAVDRRVERHAARAATSPRPGRAGGTRASAGAGGSGGSRAASPDGRAIGAAVALTAGPARAASGPRRSGARRRSPSGRHPRPAGR